MRSSKLCLLACAVYEMLKDSAKLYLTRCWLMIVILLLEAIRCCSIVRAPLHLRVPVTRSCVVETKKVCESDEPPRVKDKAGKLESRTTRDLHARSSVVRSLLKSPLLLLLLPRPMIPTPMPQTLDKPCDQLTSHPISQSNPLSIALSVAGADRFSTYVYANVLAGTTRPVSVTDRQTASLGRPAPGQAR